MEQNSPAPYQTQPPQSQAPITVPQPPPYQPPVSQMPPAHDHHKRLTIIVVTAVILIVGGLLLYTLVFASKDKSNNSPSVAATLPGVATQSRDTTRKTDINALQGQTEAYEAQNGYYPTLENFNDPTWRSENMKGLDTTALQDPQGTSAKLAATPAAGVYSYAVTPSDCDNTAADKLCTGYTLTATLESGGTYAKENLN